MTTRVVLSGSFRRDPEGLRQAYDALKSAGCEILSPANLNLGKEESGFVFLEGQEGLSPKQIEAEHLQAMMKANFIWLHCPEGYVGSSAAMEIGFAQACGVPVFASIKPSDGMLAEYVVVVASVDEAVKRAQLFPVRVPPALQAFQAYYAAAASERGYQKESLRDCLLLALEEMGELANAIRKQDKLSRDHADRPHEIAQEVADVTLYMVHLATIAGIDLQQALMEKETLNRERFLSKK